MCEIIPTIVPESFEHLEREIERLRAFARFAHIDAGDGQFVPNTTWLPQDETLPGTNALLFEAHLMVNELRELGVRFAHAGVSRIITHFESFSDHSEIAPTIEAWREAGAREVGLALELDTSIEDVTPFVLLTDFIVVMTISSLGAQGSTFEPHSLDRVSVLHEKFPALPIAVDGGINESNIADVVRAGASRICVGAALARASDPATMHQHLYDQANAV